MSAPPSPYFVKNPVTASAAWSVPTTRQPSLAGDRVLRDHPHARLDVALAEVAERRSERLARTPSASSSTAVLDVEDDGLRAGG